MVGLSIEKGTRPSRAPVISISPDAPGAADALLVTTRLQPSTSSYQPARVLSANPSCYYDHQTSTALRTDICSPVATDPTWRRLSKAVQSRLLADGRPLWHKLLVALQPNVVVLSIAKHHLDHISFDSLGPWELIHSLYCKRDGTPRRFPYKVLGRWHLVGTEPALFVFCPASQTPLGSISHHQKRKLGAIVADVDHDTA